MCNLNNLSNRTMKKSDENIHGRRQVQTVENLFLRLKYEILNVGNLFKFENNMNLLYDKYLF